MEDSKLQRAASHLNATALDDGRWAYYADESSRYYVVDADELAELPDYLDSDDEQIQRDAYSHWCAGTCADEMPQGWVPGGADHRTYTIYDGPPAESGPCSWPHHDGVELDDDLTLEDAIQFVRDTVESEAAGLSADDGYKVGQTLYAHVWDYDGTAHMVSYQLTADDLGEDDDLVVVEVMPAHLRESHRAARNWGSYPDNGAERYYTTRETARLICNDDEYNEVVGDYDPEDADYDELPEWFQ